MGSVRELEELLARIGALQADAVALLDSMKTEDGVISCDCAANQLRAQISAVMLTVGVTDPVPSKEDAQRWTTAATNGWHTDHFHWLANEASLKEVPLAWWRAAMQNCADTDPPQHLRARPDSGGVLSPDAAVLDDYFDRQLAEQQAAAEQWKQQKAHNQ